MCLFLVGCLLRVEPTEPQNGGFFFLGTVSVPRIRKCLICGVRSHICEPCKKLTQFLYHLHKFSRYEADKEVGNWLNDKAHRDQRIPVYAARAALEEPLFRDDDQFVLEGEVLEMELT